MAGPALGACGFFTVAALAYEEMAATIRATVIKVLVNMVVSPGLNSSHRPGVGRQYGTRSPRYVKQFTFPNVSCLGDPRRSAAACRNGSARQISRFRLLGPGPRRPIDTSPPV